jgi:nicotinamidase/pyrazinamidase
MEITAQDVLVVIDVQNDFCPGGVLAVADGDAVIDVIHRVAPSFEHMILTQDWHPAGHSSFASAHPGKQPFQQIELSYGTQTLWPDHCVQGSKGAEFHPSLHLPRAQLILRKGFRPQIDSYSAFFENDRVTPTGLAGYLRERKLTRVFLAGLAYDFCVGYSALDARRLGLPAVILRDACRAIDLNSSVARIEAQFSQAGVTLIESAEVGAQDAKGNQRSLDIAARADVEEGIRQGLEDARKGLTRPAWEFFDEFEASHPDLE